MNRNRFPDSEMLAYLFILLCIGLPAAFIFYVLKDASTHDKEHRILRAKGCFDPDTGPCTKKGQPPSKD